MKNDPLVAKLYNKMQQEQNEYRAWLLAQPPEEILNHAYEYSSREDILMAFENVSLRPAQLRALLESQAPLADIYKDYRDHDTNLGRLEPAFFGRCGRSARCFFR